MPLIILFGLVILISNQILHESEDSGHLCDVLVFSGKSAIVSSLSKMLAFGEVSVNLFICIDRLLINRLML